MTGYINMKFEDNDRGTTEISIDSELSNVCGADKVATVLGTINALQFDAIEFITLISKLYGYDSPPEGLHFCIDEKVLDPDVLETFFNLAKHAGKMFEEGKLKGGNLQ